MRGAVATRFLAGVGISGFGDWLTTFALAVVLYGATGSYAATAGYFLVRVAPRPLGSWLGGPLGDVASPRLALLGAAVAQGLVTAALAAPLGLHRAYWSVYLLAGLSQLIGGSWQPLTAALMARLATGPSRHSLNLAYTLLGGGAMVVSPAIGALLLPVLGAVPLVLTDAATFVVAAGLFLSLPPMPRSAARRLTVRGAAIEGFTIVLRHRMLRVIAVGAFAATVAITALQAALPALALQRFGSSADAGVLYACVGLGSMGGSLLALWPRLRHPAVIFPGMVLEIAGVGAVALAGAPLADLLILAISTAGASLSQVESGVFVQSQTPGSVGRIQGAVSTSRFLGMAGGAAIALLLALTLRNSPGTLVLALAVAGVLILVVSALGPDEQTESAISAASPLAELPE
ncbi:MAG TPA: MFS transporter [Candidatus Binatia bacterium]|nr:MFS transporter [Candidatus Binatia bacterium]